MAIPQIPISPIVPQVGMTVMSMAYGNGSTPTNSTLTSQVYRMRRGFPYTRQGARQTIFTQSIAGTPTLVAGSSNIVPPYPQFKGLALYSQAAGQVQNQFKQTMTSTRIRWPQQSVPNVASGS